MNGVVVEGLAQVVVSSMAFLIEQMDREMIQKMDKMPMLISDLTLQGNDVRFHPDIGDTTPGSRAGLRDIVNTWVDSFFNVATLFKRLDDAEGRYVKELVNDVAISMLLSRLNDCLGENEKLLSDFRAQYENFAYLWRADMNAVFAKFLEAAYDKTESGTRVPNLGKFNAEIAKYKAVQTVLNELKTPTDVGWLRVNSEPIKQALATCITKWTYMFTEHMHEYVVSKLAELHDFIADVERGLGEAVVPGDKDALKRVMAHIRDVKRSKDARDEMFAPLRDTVAALRMQGLQLDGVRLGDIHAGEYLETAPLKWEATVSRTFRKKEEIFPMQTAEIDSIKVQVETFTAQMRAFRVTFKAKAPFAFTGHIDQAYGHLDDFEIELVKVRAVVGACVPGVYQRQIRLGRADGGGRREAERAGGPVRDPAHVAVPRDSGHARRAAAA